MSKPPTDDETKQAILMAQKISDTFYYMFEVISAATKEIEAGNTNDAKVLLMSAKQSAMMILDPNKVMNHKLRKKKMEQI
jgi:hypothetical protein